MKIALCQLNFTVGDFIGNKDKIISKIKQLASIEIDLIVFSELAVCGYPPLDLLENKEFLENCYTSIKEIAAYTNLKTAAIVGCPAANNNEKGKPLYNAAYFLHDGRIKSVTHKTLLPTYDVFEEYRYFEPANQWKLVEYRGKRLAITICEDLWDNQPHLNKLKQGRLYPITPMDELVKGNPDIIINIAASPFSLNQWENRKKVLANNAKEYGLPLVYVNQTGANTDLIFDGGSIVMCKNGKIIAQNKFFEEDCSIFYYSDLYRKETIEPIIISNIENIYKALICGIKDYFQKMGFKKAVLGLSGGIDSALTATLACKALGSENVTGLLLPSRYSSDHSISDAIELANNLGIKYHTININDLFSLYENNLNPFFNELPIDTTEENIQARIRGTILMAWSNKYGSILLNTTNKSEMAVGYGTLYGDMNGGISVLGDVYKSQVFELSKYINRDGTIIPENSITKPPSAELKENQKDSDSLPDYDILDKILFAYIEENKTSEEIINLGFDKITVEKVIKLVNINEYKRFQAAPVLRISSKAFGSGRKMPLVAKY